MNVIGQTDNFQSYSYNNLGVSLKKPSDWAFVSLKNGLQLVEEKNVVYLEIRKSNSELSNTTLGQLANSDIQERFSSRKDFQLLNLSKSNISGNLPAYKAVYEFLKTPNLKTSTNEGATNKVLRITTLANGVPYIIKYVSEKNKYDSFLPIAEKIIDSLKFNVNTIVVPNEVPNNNNNDNHKSSNNGNQKSDSLKECYTGSEFNAPPCLEKDKSITYSCNDDRHFKTKDERCMYWNKKTGNWDVRFTLTGDNNNSTIGKIIVGYGDVGSYYGKGKIVIKNLDTGETLVTEDLNFAKQHTNQGNDCCVKVYTFDDSETDYGDRISAKVTGGGGSWESGPYKYENNLRMSITLDEIGEDVDGNKLIDCNGGENPPPCILGDNSVGYSCKDPRHFQSDGNQCLFWDSKHNGWALKIDLPDYNGDKNKDKGNMTADNNNNLNDKDNHKKKIDNSDEMICDSDPNTTAPSCDDLLKEQDKNNGNNGNDKEKKPDIGPPDEDFEVQGNLSG